MVITALKNKQLMKEAVERMKILGFADWVIKAFADNGLLACTERNGKVRLLSSSEAEKAKEFSEEYGYYVYHVVKDNSGRNLYLDIDPSYDEELVEIDKEDMKEYHYAHVAGRALFDFQYPLEIAAAFFDSDGTYKIVR